MKIYNLKTRLALVVTCLMMSVGVWAQTTLINPASEGGFELGADFISNGWNVSNVANNPWVTGTAVTNGAIAGNSAYISNDGGVTHAFTNTAIANNFFWRDVTVPAGETKITLSFNWLCQGESTWDNWQVFVAPTTVIPTSTTTYPGNGATNVPAGIAGATFVGNGNLNGTVQTASYLLPSSLAGTTFRLIFSWKNDGSGGVQPPAVIDNISLISQVPGTFISVVTGNWNDPLTWDANAVPTFLDNAIIDNGHVVTINATGIVINDLEIRGTLAYGATPATFNVNGNLAVNSGGLFNVFNGTTGKTLVVSKNITNNGIMDISVGATTGGNLTLNGTTVQTVSGTGIFNNGFVRNITFNNTNTSTPNINWGIDVRIAYNLNLTGARINLGSSKITYGNNAAGNTLTAPVGTGFLPGGKFSRWWTTGSTGTAITAGTDPTNVTSRYPFINAAGQNRAMYISRSSSSTTGNTAGELAVVYTDGVGMTSSLSILDGAYTITDRYNGYWNVTTEGSGYVYVSGTHTVVPIAQGAYVAANGNSRVMTDNAAIAGTHQNGTVTPAAQRIGLTTADLTVGTGLYIGANMADIVQPCTTPVGGTTTGPASVCSGVNFTLSLTGATTGVTGLTYQWQSSPDGISYSNISGATNTTYVANQTVVTYYQCIITCTNGGATDISAPLQVTMNLPTACYCGVSFPSGVEPITLVNFGTINNATSATVNGTPALENFTSISTDVAKGTTNVITVKGNTDGNFTTRIAAYIDWNQDGDFADAGEFFDLGTIVNSTGLDAVQTTGNIIVPATALLGNTRMRVIKRFNTLPIACETAGYGQAEDYTLNVICPTITAPSATGATICSGNTATINALTSLTGSTLTWFDAASAGLNLGTGTVYTTPVLSSTTSFWVEESITGCIAGPRTEVVATVNSLPNVTASSDATGNTICDGSDVTLMGAGAVSYTWTGSVTDAVAFTPTATDTYTVTGTDANSCSNTATITITVNSLPTVTASSDATANTICDGTQVTLTGAGADTYVWTGGVIDAIAFTPTATDTYTVTGTDGNGCENTATISITVNSLPTVTASSDDANNTICEGTQVTLTGGGADTYVWTGSVVDAVAFAPTATDTYTVTGTDANGCENTTSITITVSPLPTISASSNDANDSICMGESVVLSGGGAVSYVWTGGVTNGISFIPSATDTYTVTGTDIGGCENTSTITITVNNIPTVTASSDDADDAICEGLMVTLTGAGADMYTWTGGVSDGSSFAPTATDTYTVTGTDANGCSNTSTITITVNTLPTVDLTPFASSICDNGGTFSLTDGTPTGGMFSGLGVTGSTFDPAITGAGTFSITYSVTDANGCIGSDSEDLTVDLCTGIASNATQSISLYPNPTNGMFNLNINNANSNQVIITVMDMQGKVVYNELDKNISAQYNKQIDLTDLAKGIYYVRLNIGSEVKIEKLIVQ